MHIHVHVDILYGIPLRKSTVPAAGALLMIIIFGTTAIPEVRRFAVVLFLLLEGESERERSGNPPLPLC